MLIFSLALKASAFAQSPYQATRIFTDYGGYWTSAIGAVNPIYPDNSHNLLAFTHAGIVFSTGVNDARLALQGIAFSGQQYQALPIRNLGRTSDTFIGLGQLLDGVDGGPSNPPPFKPNEANLALYLTDGLQGLDIGTGVANIARGTLIFNFSEIIQPALIGDGIPDIVVTQIADPNNTFDRIYLVDQFENIVGNEIAINHTTVGISGMWRADFYRYSGALDAGLTRTNRGLRIWVADLSSFGINNTNYHLARGLRYTLNGSSDVAFVAFNTRIIRILTANDDFATIADGVSVAINVIANDQPSESLDLSTLKIVAGPSFGTVSIDKSSGIISFTATPGFYGSDSFTYEICNNSPPEQCDIAVVSVMGPIIVPLGLLEFHAEMAPDKKVKIKWTTISEKKIKKFILERSKDGLDWQEIDRIAGNTESEFNNLYKKFDENPLGGNNYYRLSILEENNVVTFSKVILVRNNLELAEELKIYPNPTQDRLILEGDPILLKSFSISNQLGQQQNSSISMISNEIGRIELDVRNLANGVYILRAGHFVKLFKKL